MAKKVYVRFGVADLLIPIEDTEDSIKLCSVMEKQNLNTYLIGYELEDGQECNEQGEVLFPITGV